jgi:hypothetical protein
MNRTLVAMSFAIAGTLCWMAVAAGLLSSQIGWFAATALYMLAGTAWWVPVGRGDSRSQKGDHDSE